MEQSRAPTGRSAHICTNRDTGMHTHMCTMQSLPQMTTQGGGTHTLRAGPQDATSSLASLSMSVSPCGTNCHCSKFHSEKEGENFLDPIKVPLKPER